MLSLFIVSSYFFTGRSEKASLPKKFLYTASRSPLLFLAGESLLFLARKGCNVFVCVYVELFPR